MADKEVSQELKKVQKAVEKAGDFSAEKLIKYNVKANEAKAKKDELANQKLIKKQQDAIDMAEKRNKIKNLSDENRENNKKIIEDARAEQQKILLKKGPSSAKIELDATNDLISLMESEFKETGKSRKDEKKMRALEKKRFQLELKQASPAERAEMIKDQAAKDSKMLTTLQAIGQRIRGNKVESGDDGGGLFKGPLKFLKGILLKGALLAFIMFLPKILDSKVMRDAIDLFQDKILPGIKAFYKNVLVPLGEVLMDLFGDLLGTIGELFDNIGATVQKFKDGDILGGILGIFETIFDFVTGILDNGLTAIYNFFAKIFGLEETDSVFGSIKGFFTDLKDKIVGFFTETIPTFFSDIITKISEAFTNIKDSVSNFFTDIYDKVVSTISGIFTGITSFISEKFTAIIDYIKNIFGFDPEGFSFANLVDLMFVGLNLAINFIKDIFGFGNPDEPFKMSDFLAGIFTKIGDFFRNLFDIDIRALASKFLPKTAVDFLLGKDETEAENLAAAQEGGLYTKETFGITGNKLSGVDTSRIPFAPEGQLQAILADDDISDENRQMIEKELAKRKLQKDLQKGNLGVAEQIDEFGGTDRAIREAAAREAASTNIVAPDQRVVSNSSTTVVQQETITPTYNGYNLVTTEPDY